MFQVAQKYNYTLHMCILDVHAWIYARPKIMSKIVSLYEFLKQKISTKNLLDVFENIMSSTEKMIHNVLSNPHNLVSFSVN